MAATTNTAGLIAARFFLGVPESGIGKGAGEPPIQLMQKLTRRRSSRRILLFVLVELLLHLLSVSVKLTHIRYLPKERAFRLGILFSANALGVASSNLLALAIDNVSGPVLQHKQEHKVDMTCCS